MIKYVDGEKLVTMIEEDHLYGFHDILAASICWLKFDNVDLVLDVQEV